MFFVKLFGCKIVEANIPINLKEFATSILEKKAHPNIYLAICPSLIGYVGSTDVKTTCDEMTKEVVFAVWFYELPKFSVRIVYAARGEQRQGLKNTWHPSTLTKIIKLGRI